MALIYVTPSKTMSTLKEAIENGESFVAATDDHAYAVFVDWAEMEDDDRQPLLELVGNEEEAERELVAASEGLREDFLEDVLGPMSQEERTDSLGEDLITLARWLEMQGKGLT